MFTIFPFPSISIDIPAVSPLSQSEFTNAVSVGLKLFSKNRDKVLSGWFICQSTSSPLTLEVCPHIVILFSYRVLSDIEGSRMPSSPQKTGCQFTLLVPVE